MTINIDYISDIQANDFTPSFDFTPTPRPVDASVDWLRCTVKNIKHFHDFINKFLPFLKAHKFNFHDTGHGMNGYTQCWQILFKGQVVGHICVDALDKMGGMFELTGFGCQWLQVRWDLWCSLMAGFLQYGFKIARLDVCQDYRGSAWINYKCNILEIAERIDGGLFKMGKGTGKPAAVTFVGDWLKVVVDRMHYSEYIPTIHAPAGLTINVGGSQSVNKFVVYEKGKQMMGKNPEMYDGSLNDWIRIERRFTRGSGRSEVVIPFDFALCPDSAFVYNCEGLKSFNDAWTDYRKTLGIDIDPKESVDLDFERVGLLKRVSLSKTALHVACQSSRFFRTLKLMGVSVVDFVDLIIHDDPSKGFDPALHNSSDIMNVLNKKYA